MGQLRLPIKAIQAWVVALGLIAVGIACYRDAYEVSEVLPVHEKVGIAISLFGGVYLLALSLGDTGAGRRLKCFLICLAFSTLAAASAWFVLPSFQDSYRLAQEGVQAQARVSNAREFLRDRRLASKVEIRFHDHRADLQVFRDLEKGERLEVVYLPNDPTVVREGTESDTAAKLLSHQGTPFWLLTALFLLFAICALFYFVGIFTGARELAGTQK
ncbi:MAG: DUF3592 domain-containing protein [Verrucomicrobiota bacterium]